jgi:hypothetical protein
VHFCGGKSGRYVVVEKHTICIKKLILNCI